MDGLRSVAEGGVWLYDSEHGRHHVIREVLVGVVLAAARNRKGRSRIARGCARRVSFVALEADDGS